MKKRMIVGGSVGVVVLLVLVMFPTVVGAQTTKATINERIQIFKNKLLKDKNTKNSNNFIFFLLALLVDMLMPIIYGIFLIFFTLFP